ncbi:unnamed protein product [Peronospora effusa]|nr:unnamed protein product [Peronospora effusa]
MTFRKGVVTSVVYTLSFHMATFVFACLLATMFACSLSLLLLLVGFLLVGSLPAARKFTWFLWRTEMALNALVATKNELEPVLRRRKSSITNQRVAHDTAGSQQLEQGPVMEEFTDVVIWLSLFYFLVVKWILDLIFSAVPLILWIVSIAQVLPKDVGLSDVKIVPTMTLPAQVLMAMAFAFLAHQIGVTSSRGLVFVSRNVSRVVFLKSESEDMRVQETFRSPIATQMEKISSGGDGASSSYGAMDGKHLHSRQGNDSASKSTQMPSARALTRSLKQLQSSEDVTSSFSSLTTSTATPVTSASVSPSLISAETAVPSSVSDRLNSAFLMSSSEDSRKRAPILSSRVRSRPSTLVDNRLRAVSDNSGQPNRAKYNEREDKRSVGIAHVSENGSTHDISDVEVLGRCDRITRSYEDDDMATMRVYAPLTYMDSPPRHIGLNPSPIYRGPSEKVDYDSFSPINSPSRNGVSGDSFGDDHDYDVLSPQNSTYDADIPTYDFKQIYRSIQMAAEPETYHSVATEKGDIDAVSEFKEVSGRRDRVNFSAFAPPSVCPSSKPFQFTVWAFLLNQQFEMQELAKSDHLESRKLSLETKLNVRRGALVHVTIEVPNGFKVLNDVTQGFAWEGEMSNVCYDVVCTEGAAFGRVLFKAHIIVGSSVAVLNAFVLVGSRALDPNELEADVLEGWVDVMEQTYREIPFHSLKMKELVGQGYFGDAYRASLDGQDVVVKTIRASEFGETTCQIVREFQHEAAMLNMFGHHPCIVPFVGASTDTSFPLALVTKYLPYGSLEDNLRGDSCFSIDERTGMLKDAAAGLLNIHEGGFIHRDLAARNCLVDQGNHVRICDFGLCRQSVRSETVGMLIKDAVGPVRYMAPESLRPPHPFTYDTDVYMFGVLMWETYTGSTPFPSLTPVEAMMHVLRGERLPIPKELPESLRTLMQSCFLDSPAERPSMQEVLTALNASLVSSQRASVAIAARTATDTAAATATATAATATAISKSVSSWTNLHKQQDRSIWLEKM